MDTMSVKTTAARPDAKITMNAGRNGAMSGMEHADDKLDVPPILDQRVVTAFCLAVQRYADANGIGREAAARLNALRGRLDALVDLARLCRLAALGEPRSVNRVLDELRCIAVDFPDKPIEPPPDAGPGGSQGRAQLAALVDLFAGAAFVSAGNHDQLAGLVVGLARAVESALAFPLAFAAESTAYIGTDDRRLLPAHAAAAIANATQRLLENDAKCTPAAPAWLRHEIDGLADRWIRLNPVSSLLDALMDSNLQRAVTGISPQVAAVGDAVTLHLNGGYDLDKKPYVMFCPHQPAKILSSLEHAIQVLVPDGAQTGPVAVVTKPTRHTLDEISALEQAYQDDYPDAWAASAFAAIPLERWAYPAAFQAPGVEIRPVPSSAAVAVLDAAGRRLEGATIAVGQDVKLQFRLDPPGSQTELELEASATGGEISRGSDPGTLIYRATQPGIGLVELKWGSLIKRLSLGAFLVWGASPRRLLLVPGGAGVIEISVNFRNMTEDTTFTLRGTTGEVVVPQSVVIPRGERLVTVGVTTNPGPHTPQVNRASDVIQIEAPASFGANRDQVEVWIAQPQGRWDPTIEYALAIVGVHAVVLRTGSVLYFSFDARAVNSTDKFNNYFADPNLGSYQIWDPNTETAGPVKPVGRNVFCGGQCALPDGTIFVPGGQDGAGAADVTGHWGDLFGALGGNDPGALKDIHTYDPILDTWTRWSDMHDGRYYPTCQALDDGSAFMAGGLSNLQQFIMSGSNWAQNDHFEVFANGNLAPKSRSRQPTSIRFSANCRVAASYLSISMERPNSSILIPQVSSPGPYSCHRHRSDGRPIRCRPVTS